MSASPSTPTSFVSRKQKRLTYACNYCRSRKVKCDDKPNCSNCTRAGLKCVTTDRRHPGQLVQRRVAQAPPQHPEEAASQVSIFSSQADKLNDLSAPIQAGIGEHSRLPTPTSVARAPLPVLPRFTGGNSLQVLTQWLDLAFLRIGKPLKFSYQHSSGPHPGKPRTISPMLTTSYAFPPLARTAETLTDNFLSTFNIAYPLFERPGLLEILQLYENRASHGQVFAEPPGRLVIANLISVIVVTNDASPDIMAVTEHIRAAYSRISSILAEASLRSTQALFLLAMVLRGYNDPEMAWHLTALAISIAQSLGLHRSQSVRQRSNMGETLTEECTRAWWALYSLDKALSLELEKPSSIHDSECNQPMPTVVQEPPIFESVIKLAKIQSCINARCVMARSFEESYPLDYHNIIHDKLVSSGELDQMLVSWEENLESILRPSNHSYCQPNILPYVSFMALQYHQTLVLLHRNTLLVSHELAQREIENHCSDKPYLHRIRNGRAICGNSARAIISILNNLNEYRANSILNSLNAPLIAAYALAIHTLKFPSSRLAKADLELQAQAIEFAKQQRTTGEDKGRELERLLEKLQAQVTLAVKSARTNTRVSNASVVSNGGVSTGCLPSSGQNSSNVRREESLRAGHENRVPVPGTGSNWETNFPADMSITEYLQQDGFLSGLLSNGPGAPMNPINDVEMDWDTIVAALDLPGIDVYNQY